MRAYQLLILLKKPKSEDRRVRGVPQRDERRGGEDGKTSEEREVEAAERIECRLNGEILSLPGAEIVAPGFGSSDCPCPSHLVYLGEELCPGSAS